MSHQNWSHDIVLRSLTQTEGVVADLARAFPGRAAASESTEWLDNWFRSMVKSVADGAPLPKVTVKASGPGGADLSILDREPVPHSVRLLSIRPHYFRGFRELSSPVQVDGELVVLQGRNSSGKTSISEALEWLVTGALSRRETAQLGHSRELENCISHQFRPKGETTRVEASLSVDGEVLRLCRVLKSDYSAKQKATAASVLQLDGRDLPPDEERQILDRFFAGVNPILMQHTLRQFVHDSPSHRRVYFERLLRIDELTALIERAVIGDGRLSDFPPPAGQTLLTAWSDVKRTASHPAVLSQLHGAEGAAHDKVGDAVRAALLAYAKLVFPDLCQGAASLKHARELVLAAQERSREQSLPLLKTLRPKFGAEAISRFLETEQTERTKTVKARASFVTARQAATAIQKAQLAVAEAFDRLAAAKLIDLESMDAQRCPVCEYPDPPTLTASRVTEIRSWEPLSKALDKASRDWVPIRTRYDELLAGLERVISGALPPPPSHGEIERIAAAVTTELREAILHVADEAHRSRPIADDALKTIRSARDIVAESPPTTAEAPFVAACDAVLDSLSAVSDAIHAYSEAFHSVEEIVAIEARSDAEYSSRESWLIASSDPGAVGQSLLWERAKIEVQTLLSNIRAGLIELRAALIDDVRTRFSDDMTAIWELLRNDRASRFSRLDIPPVRGRGYKLEFGVKAMLSAAQEEKEVDALRVMSESQINVIGIAAYVTRANRLGHKLLVFDDPVQSMDEDHYRSFAAKLLPTLLDDGFQVIILTHSDRFARDISHQHYLRDGYVTLQTRASRRHGCQVDEGNRRVAERLRIADKAAEDGRLPEAWRYVRLAIERLYTLAMHRADQTFDPERWRDQDARYMWDQGVGRIVEAACPDAGVRLREILSFAAEGAHDKSTRGATDVHDGTDFIRGLLNKLRLGDG